MLYIGINERNLQELGQLCKEANIVNIFYYLEYMSLDFVRFWSYLTMESPIVFKCPRTCLHITFTTQNYVR